MKRCTSEKDIDSTIAKNPTGNRRGVSSARLTTSKSLAVANENKNKPPNKMRVSALPLMALNKMKHGLTMMAAIAHICHGVTRVQIQSKPR